MLEDQNVLRNWRAGEIYVLRRLRERGLERSDRGEVERSIAPLEDLDRLEAVTLQRLRELSLERRASAGGAERTIAGGPAGAAGDLGELGRIGWMIPSIGRMSRALPRINYRTRCMSG